MTNRSSVLVRVARGIAAASISLVFVALISCSSSAAGSGDIDGGAVGDGSADADGSSCPGTTASGMALCTSVLSALCARRVSCCSSDGLCGTADNLNACNCLGIGGESCSQESTQSCSGSYCGDTCSTASCSMWMSHDPNGHDCTQPSFANGTACSTTATTCANDVAQIACSDFTGGTWNWPASCNAFWSMF